jgi:hypothetical protein
MCSSACCAEHAQQPLTAAAARYSPYEHLRLAHAQVRRIGGVAQVAGKCDFQAAVQCRTVDRCDVHDTRTVHSQDSPLPAIAQNDPFAEIPAESLERACQPGQPQHRVEHRHDELHHAHRNRWERDFLHAAELARVQMSEKAALDAAGKHDGAYHCIVIYATRESVEVAQESPRHEIERRVRVAHRQDAAVLLELQRVEREIAGRRHAIPQ